MVSPWGLDVLGNPSGRALWKSTGSPSSSLICCYLYFWQGKTATASKGRERCPWVSRGSVSEDSERKEEESLGYRDSNTSPFLPRFSAPSMDRRGEVWCCCSEGSRQILDKGQSRGSSVIKPSAKILFSALRSVVDLPRNGRATRSFSEPFVKLTRTDRTSTY